MGKLVIVVGNTGVGKTTLTEALRRRLALRAGLEGHVERPFQGLFAGDLRRYAFPNQVDYLLLRAEQEREIRAGEGVGIQDGGLDLDFYVFTRHFHRQGYLSAAEFATLERLHGLLRGLLPPPELVIHLTAPAETLRERFRQRGRALEIAREQDLEALGALLEDWLGRVAPERVARVDAAAEDETYSAAVERLAGRILALEGGENTPQSTPLRS